MYSAAVLAVETKFLPAHDTKVLWRTVALPRYHSDADYRWLTEAQEK